MCKYIPGNRLQILQIKKSKSMDPTSRFYGALKDIYSTTVYRFLLGEVAREFARALFYEDSGFKKILQTFREIRDKVTILFTNLNLDQESRGRFAHILQSRKVKPF